MLSIHSLSAHILFVPSQFYHIVLVLSNPLSFYLNVKLLRFQYSGYPMKILQPMSTVSIKLNYLHAVLSILNAPVVLEATLKTLNINIPATQDVYTTRVHMVNDNSLDIDKMLNLLVENNIASVNKTLILND